MTVNEAVLTHRIVEGSEIVYLPVDRIAPNPYQPRRVFQRESIEELANSIREYGVMQPIIVRLINGAFYELVAGERRLRATKMIGLREIPAIVVQISDKDSAVLALIENLQRENLNFFDEAEGLKSLVDDYNLTQEEVAKKIGKSQSTVANKLRILRLPREAQRIILENELSERHARALLKLPKDDNNLIMNILQKVVAAGMTVKETERLVENVLRAAEKTDEDLNPKQKIKSYFRDLRIFRNSIEQVVDQMKTSGLDTDYDVEEHDDGCIISIMVSYT